MSIETLKTLVEYAKKAGLMDKARAIEQVLECCFGIITKQERRILELERKIKEVINA